MRRLDDKEERNRLGNDSKDERRYERGGDDREKRDVVRCGDRERNAVTIQRQDTIRGTRRRDDAFESIVYMIYR